MGHEQIVKKWYDAQITTRNDKVDYLRRSYRQGLDVRWFYKKEMSLVRRIYKHADLDAPKRLIVVASPYAGILAACNMNPDSRTLRSRTLDVAQRIYNPQLANEQNDLSLEYIAGLTAAARPYDQEYRKNEGNCKIADAIYTAMLDGINV